MTTDHIVEQILTAARRKPGKKDIVFHIHEAHIELGNALERIIDRHRQGEIDRKNGEYWKAQGVKEE